LLLFRLRSARVRKLGSALSQRMETAALSMRLPQANVADVVARLRVLLGLLREDRMGVCF
jgi:hypothetical protein